RARCRAGPARGVLQRVACDGCRRLDRRPDRVRRHHHSAPGPAARRTRSPAGAAGGGAVWRRVSGRVRRGGTHDPRADRASRRHHHLADRRTLLSMAAHKKTVTALLVAAALALLCAARPTAQPNARPQRIISLVPAVTEMLYAIGAGPRVVAVSSYDYYPPDVRKLPNVGALLDPNVERILSLKPDLVVAYGTQSELKQQLVKAGISVFDYRHAGLPDVTATIRALGERSGDGQRARELAAAI